MKSPKDVLENIGHRRGEFRPEAGPARAAAAVLEGGMAEAVVGGALLRVLQRVIGLGYFLELVLGVRVSRIAVRVELHGKLAVGALERRLVGPLGDAENFVKVAFGQSGCVLMPCAPWRLGRETSASDRYVPPLLP
jgi:hypothetical protein